MEGIIIAIEGAAIEMIILIEIGVGHSKGRIGTGEIVEVQVTVGQGQVLEQAQIEIGFDVLSGENMTILPENVLLDKLDNPVGKLNKYSQMFNMDEDQTLVQTSLIDTNRDELTIILMDTRGNLYL